VRSDQPRHHQRHLADAASKLEHAHAGGNACTAEECFRDRIDDGCLRRQAAPFTIGVAEDVSGLWGHSLSVYRVPREHTCRAVHHRHRQTASYDVG
jgi:hypothetical protein